MLRSYCRTIQMTARQKTNGGILSLAPQMLFCLLQLVPMLYLWRGLFAYGVQEGMSLAQTLTYTYLGVLLADLLVIKSPLTDWLYQGLVISLYERPMGIVGQVAAQTFGRAVPGLVLCSLPLALFAPAFEVSLAPVSLWWAPSLLLCVSLGFAIDFLFACLLIRMMNGSWIVYSIRNAVTALFSGSVIPFAALPWGLDKVFAYQPFGSLGGAVLSIYTGLSEPLPTLGLQLAWNLLLWPLAALAFRKSREKLVSHGG